MHNKVERTAMPEKAMSYNFAQLDKDLARTDKSHHLDKNHTKIEFERYFVTNAENWPIARLNNLIAAMERTKADREKTEQKRQHVHTFKIKIIGLAKEYKTSYQEVLNILNEQATLKCN
jgi:predicted membrane-bound dolichyl-phosphate-mannose-protein mannosyltransferase